MERAAVLIGVRKSGDLPELQAVDAGVEAMRRWAQSQGIRHVASLTDKAGREVDARKIYDAVERMVQRPTIGQLIVYFAGHGVNNNQSEYWLLSGAPTNPNEAINVAGSALLAQRSGVPHVVIISDACRTAPEGIHAQGVTGSLMFPNQPVTPRPADFVDQFFACLLGDPANEIRDPDDASRVFRSLYTEVLVESLYGKHREMLVRVDEGGTAFNEIRPWPLRNQLPGLVTDRLRQLEIFLGVSQTPDAKLTSDPEKAWISRMAVTARRRRRRAASGDADRHDGWWPPTVTSAAAHFVNSAISGAPVASGPGTELEAVDPGAAEALSGAAESLRVEFGPFHHETRTGFRVHGARIEDAFSVASNVELLDELLAVIAIGEERPAANVLLRFASGTCAVLPALQDFIGQLTFDHGNLIDVAYRPVRSSPRWPEYRSRSEELKRLHVAIASTSRLGLFKLDPDNALPLARRMQELKGLDPSLAVYAAYGYHDLGRQDLIREMREYLRVGIGVDLYDVALLDGEPPSTGSDAARRTVPWFPLLARGWALAAAYGLSIAPRATEAQALVSSLWTLFGSQTYDVIRRAMEGEAG